MMPYADYTPDLYSYQTSGALHNGSVSEWYSARERASDRAESHHAESVRMAHGHPDFGDCSEHPRRNANRSRQSPPPAARPHTHTQAGSDRHPRAVSDHQRHAHADEEVEMTGALAIPLPIQVFEVASGSVPKCQRCGRTRRSRRHRERSPGANRRDSRRPHHHDPPTPSRSIHDATFGPLPSGDSRVSPRQSEPERREYEPERQEYASERRDHDDRYPESDDGFLYETETDSSGSSDSSDWAGERPKIGFMTRCRAWTKVVRGTVTLDRPLISEAARDLQLESPEDRRAADVEMHGALAIPQPAAPSTAPSRVRCSNHDCSGTSRPVAATQHRTSNHGRQPKAPNTALSTVAETSEPSSHTRWTHHGVMSR